MEFVMKFV